MQAIVYTSNTGHTEKYARLLGEKTALPVYSLIDAKAILDKKSEIIYLGWLFANHVRGYKSALKKYSVRAVCAVGLCDTGTATDEVRKANSIPDSTPLFTMQGGMDKTKLRGINKLMINMLTKSLTAKKDRTEEDERMLNLLMTDADYVCEENAALFFEWFSKSE